MIMEIGHVDNRKMLGLKVTLELYFIPLQCFYSPVAVYIGLPNNHMTILSWLMFMYNLTV